MKQAFAVIVALLLAAFVGWPTVSTAIMHEKSPKSPEEMQRAPAERPPAPGTQEQAPGAQKEQKLKSKISSVDKSGKELTLEDGTKLMIPEEVKVSRSALKKGANITASYKEEGGQKVVTRITVEKG